MTPYEDRVTIQNKVRYLIFRNNAAEGSGCAQTSYSPDSFARHYARNELKSRDPTYPRFIGNELKLRVLIRGNYFLGQTVNVRRSFTMSGSPIHAAFKSRGADVQCSLVLRKTSLDCTCRSLKMVRWSVFSVFQLVCLCGLANTLALPLRNVTSAPSFLNPNGSLVLFVHLQSFP